MRLRFASGLMIAGLLSLAGAPGALADTNSSSNWAGYAIHRSGVRFTMVSAVWRQPSATCQSGRRSYSAFWVGLGGYNQRSNALEQVGTEVDCSASGAVRSSAWYELVPAASKTISFQVRPGDLVAATVSVVGHRVSVSLYNGRTKRWLRRTLYASSIDLSSAEWIAEAPSDCVSESVCQTLRLANFGSATFDLTYAQTTTGHTGSISDPAWTRSRISLTPGGRRFVAAQGAGATVGKATPSALNSAGTGFRIAYSTVSVQMNPFQLAGDVAVRAGRLVHTGP